MRNAHVSIAFHPHPRHVFLPVSLHCLVLKSIFFFFFIKLEMSGNTMRELLGSTPCETMSLNTYLSQGELPTGRTHTLHRLWMQPTLGHTLTLRKLH